ncbi:hypothetical protein Aeqsu_2394 [Aequorivita sublithincola DSM 14238]|uniref:DUF2147 domain-containing protein n=1 Tax=Aequorivita sublithincola (strain DSM 14238 / LMG 21431 / ACAM 643 / 9-3) TaxID=746697 RepID=I3YXY6_AEQSU|nr:DUF2147 domain-containing protein [Aequorivita sublithincola]AFL81854.1 hypothetical protein Aeqsu_2394 [Aequorivita sublithincola DSM 14238]
MKKILLTISLVALTVMTAVAQDVTGKWKTIDDETGEAKSVVEIYKENGKIYGKVVEIFDASKRDRTCTECSGSDKNKSIMGLVIIKGLEKDGDEYNDGTITDPTNGKVYKCYIELDGPNTLDVRGYIGFSLLGRTQTWKRVN